MDGRRQRSKSTNELRSVRIVSVNGFIWKRNKARGNNRNERKDLHSHVNLMCRTFSLLMILIYFFANANAKYPSVFILTAAQDNFHLTWGSNPFNEKSVTKGYMDRHVQCGPWTPFALTTLRLVKKERHCVLNCSPSLCTKITSIWH